jgi:hypothetical protein
VNLNTIKIVAPVVRGNAALLLTRLPPLILIVFFELIVSVPVVTVELRDHVKFVDPRPATDVTLVPDAVIVDASDASIHVHGVPTSEGYVVGALMLYNGEIIKARGRSINTNVLPFVNS